MPISRLLQARLNTEGITNAMPAWQIISNANLIAPTTVSSLFGDPVPQALVKLMQSYYDYGRMHWTWAMSAGVGAANGGLVKGLINACACASFNHNFKWLAETGLGITGITNGQDTSQFLTVPGGVCIDSKWPGNVRTSTQGFQDFKCFKFYQHYWVVYGGLNYDVCYNNTFQSTDQIIWTKLIAPEPELARKAGLTNQELYKLAKTIPAFDYLVKLPGTGPTGWPVWQLVTKAQVKALR